MSRRSRDRRHPVTLGVLSAALAFTSLSSTAAAGPPVAHRAVAEVTSDVVVGPVETVDEDHAADSFQQVAVVVGWEGTTTAVWRADDREDPELDRIVASVRRADGSWSLESVADSVDLDHFSLRVAAGGAESVSAVWASEAEGASTVYEVHREGSGWSVPRVVGRGNRPEVAVDGRGTATVVWSSDSGAHVRSRDAVDGWGPRRDYGTDTWVGEPGVATNRAGDVAAIWTEYEPDRARMRVRAAVRSREAVRWPRAETVPGRPWHDNGPSLGVDRRGRVLAAWTVSRRVVWTRRSAGGSWTRSDEVPGDVGQIGEYGWSALSQRPGGAALLRWESDHGGTYTARYRPRTGFARARRLSTDTLPMFEGMGTPLLAPDLTAVVPGALGAHLDGTDVALRWQRLGEAWSPPTTIGFTQGSVSAAGRGRRLVVVYWDGQALLARLVEVSAGD